MKDSAIAKPLYWILLIGMLGTVLFFFFFDHDTFTMIEKWQLPIALFLGLAFALVFGTPCPKFNKKVSKFLLQASVVGLGFGMNLEKSLQSGWEGMLFTIVSVVGVMVIGWLLGKVMKINTKTSYLVSSGTAICGGSAIAAVGGVLNAKDDEMAASLGAIFILNAIALFIFPPMGDALQMSQEQFGTWAAIAIHDTSSVVGAGAAFGNEACEIATLIKCTRALWIIPLAFVTILIFRNKGAGGSGKTKVSIPWFIFLFIFAMIINTYSRETSPMLATTYDIVYKLAKIALVAVLFAIGAGLSLKVLKQVGFKPLVQAIILWVVIGVSSLLVVLKTIG